MYATIYITGIECIHFLLMNKNSPEISALHLVLEELGPEGMRDAFRRMLLIRVFEERLDQLYLMGRTRGTLHLSIGQEATSVGALTALSPGDRFFSHHRGHGHALAWTDNPERVLADVLGKAGGYCGGFGGTMHMADVRSGFLGGNGIVAGGLPMSLGVGLAIQLRNEEAVCLVFFGDGAVNEGAFHEALNMASIWQLPVVYLCENNRYAMSTPVEQAINIEEISARAAAYGIPGHTIDGNDFLEVYSTVNEAVARARRGEGPSLIEALTYRIKGHSRSDRQAYRSRDEVRRWQQPEQDPVSRLASTLTDVGILAKGEADRLREAEVARVDAAVAAVEASADPDPAQLLDHVYA